MVFVFRANNAPLTTPKHTARLLRLPILWRASSRFASCRAARSNSTQPGHPCADRQNEYGRWFLPPLGKIRRVLRNSRPCYHPDATKYVNCSTTNKCGSMALGIRTRGPGFDSRVVPLFHWAATLGKLFTHIASPVSQLQESAVQKRSFRHLSGYGD